MLSGNDGPSSAPLWVDVVPLSSPPRRSSPSDGTTYTRRNRSATVARCLDQPPGSSIPSVSNPTPRTSNPTEHTIRSTPLPGPQHLPAPPTHSLDDGTHGRVGPPLSDDGRSTFSHQSEIEIDWPSILSSGFPHFELPGLRFGGDDNAPGEPREERQ